MASPVKPQIVVIALVLIAGGASLTAVPQRPAISEQQAAATEIDFAALHRQASDALDNLRSSQDTQRAPAALARRFLILSARSPRQKRHRAGVRIDQPLDRRAVERLELCALQHAS